MIEAPPRMQELQGRKAVWSVAEPVDAALAEQVHGASRMVAHLLFQRGCTSAEAINRFLTGTPVEHNPFAMPDMAAAVNRIRKAVDRHERVAIYGDFDCDGLTASAIMLQTLRAIGLDPEVVIPTREDGHGTRAERFRRLAADGVTVVVTVDCGITDFAPIKQAQSLGVDVIVTDHHQPAVDGTLPQALVVSASRLDSDYPFRGLSGAGVAYKFAQAILESPEAYEQMLDLAALGTIADIVPLRDENRTLVLKGLSRLQSTKRCGLRALFAVAGVDSQYLDAASVGFYLGPRINAANRLADPAIAFDLISAVDPVEAQRLAQELDGHNGLRQDQVRQAVADAIERIGKPAVIKASMRDGLHDPLITVIGDWVPGISGILASELVSRYCVPALAGSSRADGQISVSGRSVSGVDLLEILNAANAARPDLELGGGGHAMACGFTSSAEVIDAAYAELGFQARGRVPVNDLTSVIAVDAQVGLGQMDMRSLDIVERLGPYGCGFPEPVFLCMGICLSSRKKFGPSGQHLKMTAKSGKTKVAAIIFGCDPELEAIPEEQPVDVVFSLQRDVYGGLERPQIQIKDWRPHEPSMSGQQTAG